MTLGVGINSMEQLQSLTAQVSHLTRLTAAVPQWLLSDVYMDIATSRTGSSRKEFNQMLKDCKSHKLEIVITKDVSRFGRDTVEVLDAFNQLKALGVRVIFEGNSLDTANTSSNLMVAVIESIAQAENESRRSIEWILSNEKYTGNVELLKSSKSEVHYLASGSHPAIISK